MQDEIPSIVPNDIDKHVTHHYAENNGVHIHYTSMGKGPLIVMSFECSGYHFHLLKSVYSSLTNLGFLLPFDLYMTWTGT